MTEESIKKEQKSVVLDMIRPEFIFDNFFIIDLFNPGDHNDPNEFLQNLEVIRSYFIDEIVQSKNKGSTRRTDHHTKSVIRSLIRKSIKENRDGIVLMYSGHADRYSGHWLMKDGKTYSWADLNFDIASVQEIG